MVPAARLLLPFGLLLAGTSAALTVDLSLSEQSAAPGAGILIPLSLVGHGEPVSGLQFDLAYDPAALSLVPVVGQAARASGKTIHTVSNNGLTRILITELNQNAISDGSLVSLFVNVAPSAGRGPYAIHFQAAVASDMLGRAIEVTTTDGSISIAPGTGSPISAEGVLNAASLLPGAVSPGEIVTIIGSTLVPSLDPRTVAVRFDGFAAPLLYAAADQINAVVPFEMDGRSAALMEVSGSSGQPVQISVDITAAAPAIFSLDATGTGQAAILNQDGTINSPANPAQPGSIVALFATGAGQTDPPGVDGLIINSILPRPRLPVSAKIGDSAADILYAGAAPSLISGVLQVNCRIPAGTHAGNSVPVVLIVGNIASPPATLSVR